MKKYFFSLIRCQNFTQFYTQQPFSIVNHVDFKWDKYHYSIIQEIQSVIYYAALHSGVHITINDVLVLRNNNDVYYSMIQLCVGESFLL